MGYSPNATSKYGTVDAKLIADLIDESGFELNALTCSLTRTYKIYNVGFGGSQGSVQSKDLTTYIWGVGNVQNFPRIGDAHPSRFSPATIDTSYTFPLRTYVRAITIKPIGDNQFTGLVHYEGTGDPGFTADFDSIQAQLIKNFDIYGNTTLIPYSPSLILATAQQKVKPLHIADINDTVMYPCVKFVKMCNYQETIALRNLENTVNGLAFGGGSPGTWLCLSVRAQTDNNKLWRVAGVLVYKPESWVATGLYLDANGNKVSGTSKFPTQQQLLNGDNSGLIGPNGTLVNTQGTPPSGWRRFQMKQINPNFGGGGANGKNVLQFLETTFGF